MSVRVPSDEPLIGRHAETERLQAILDRVRDGTGRFVLLSGEAGVGNTRLVEEVLGGSAFAVRTGRARQDASRPYGPIASALRGCLADAEPSDCGPLAGNLALLLPELGAPPGSADPEVLPEAIADALLTLAGRGPLALFLDDLQWADNATLAFLPLLADRIAAAPLVIVGAYRSDEIGRGHPLRGLRSALRRAHVLDEIEVPPLDAAGTAELLAASLPGAPSPSLARTVHERTQGIPLYVEELAAALAARSLLREGDDGLELAAGENVPVPESIRDAVQLRLDMATDGAREALEIAAVVGSEFDLEFVSRLVSDASGVEAMLSGPFVAEAEPGTGAFRHALVRESIRSDIGWSRRRALHRRIATYLDRAGSAPEIVAEHWVAAGEDAPARKALLEVAERACRMHAYPDAAHAAQRALDRWPEEEDEPGRLAALERLADCAQWSGRFEEAVEARRTIADREAARGDAGAHARALRALADAQGLAGAWDAAVESRREAARRFEEADDAGEAAVEHLAIGGRMTAQNRLDAALEETRRAIALAERAKRTEIVVRAKGAEGNLLAMRGEAEAGRVIAQEALNLALEENLRDAASEAYRRLASVLDYSSDFAGSRDAYATAVEYCESAGDDATARICLGCMSFIVFRTGEWKRALDVCARVLADPASPPGSAVIAHAIQGVIRAKRGETRAAKTQLREALDGARRAQAAIIELVSRHGLALVAEFEDEPERAAELHAQVLEGWRNTQDRHDLVPVFVWQSTFFGRRGDAPEASERAAVLASMAAGLGNPETDAARIHALAEVALLAGDAEEAAAQFERALAIVEKLEIPLEVALTSWRTGVAQARCGRRDVAVDRLNNAYRVTRKLGARPIAARIAADLLELGERVEEGRRPDEELRAARVGLTRRQVEIVRLVAEGLTNKEIAGKLFVSPRTVDMHVSNALDRLDCRSRTEAARKAAELGLLD